MTDPSVGRASRFVWLLPILVALFIASTTTAAVAAYAYDAMVVARVEVRPLNGFDADETQLVAVLKGSASPHPGDRGTSTTPLSRSVATKSGPNPYGKAGGPAHQAGVQDVVDDISARGLRADTEIRIETPGGLKNRRYADVGGYDPEGNLVEIHQVGRQTMGGVPVARERAALVDIMSNNPGNASVYFHPYN